jgi:hypothetical protein
VTNCSRADAVASHGGSYVVASVFPPERGRHLCTDGWQQRGSFSIAPGRTANHWIIRVFLVKPSLGELKLVGRKLDEVGS